MIEKGIGIEKTLNFFGYAEFSNLFEKEILKIRNFILRSSQDQYRRSHHQHQVTFEHFISLLSSRESPKNNEREEIYTTFFSCLQEEGDFASYIHMPTTILQTHLL